MRDQSLEELAEHLIGEADWGSRSSDDSLRGLRLATKRIDAEALKPLTDDRDFDAIAHEVRAAIANKLEQGLDRLHTFVVKFVRTLCVADL